MLLAPSSCWSCFRSQQSIALSNTVSSVLLGLLSLWSVSFWCFCLRPSTMLCLTIHLKSMYFALSTIPWFTLRSQVVTHQSSLPWWTTGWATALSWSNGGPPSLVFSTKSLPKKSMKVQPRSLLIMGWLVIFIIPQIVSQTNPIFWGLMLMGGLCYTVGAGFMLRKTILPHDLAPLHPSSFCCFRYLAIVYFMWYAHHSSEWFFVIFSVQ